MNIDNLTKLVKSRDTIKHVLVLSGDVPEIGLLENGKYTIYASDGGSNRLFERGIIPDYIIGDMDSVNKEYLAKYDYPEKQLIEIKEQDSNDFEKSVRFIMNQGAKAITVFGFGGGDLEHTLNNYSVLLKFCGVISLFVCNGDRMGFSIEKSFEMESKAGDKISFIPMGELFISTKGLKWELDREYLILGNREGGSNQSTGDKIEVRLHKGIVTMFVPSIFPHYYVRKA